MPLSRSEAEIINYLYQHRREPRYAAEIARELGIKKRTVYDSLDSLEKKEIVQKQLRGKMKFYTLDDKWMEIAEAAKLPIAETDEATLTFKKEGQDSTQVKKFIVQLENFLPLAYRVFPGPTIEKLKEALATMKELMEEK